MRRFVVGTAGHVDHGKTTLVRALTGIDTDRLPEERRRGITIELGFANWPLDANTAASIIDVPGHRRLVHTMIAGASGIDLVMLVVAADEGVMPQTREHLAACELLGIRRAVVAITKIDRVDHDLAELAGEEVRSLLGTRFENEIVLVSARSGAGLDVLRDTVRGALDRLPARAASPRAHLSVDRVFSVKGAGSVVTGTLVRGRLDVGADVQLARSTATLSSSVRGLHVHDASVAVAEAPTRLAINLAGIALTDITRGDVVTTDPEVRATDCFDAAIEIVRPVRSGATVDVYVGTARSAGRLMLFRRPAEEGDAPLILGRIKLGAPLVVVGGDRFVLRGSSTKGPAGAVIGGGRVLDARPPRVTRRPRRIAALVELARGTAASSAKALVEEAAPAPLFAADLGARFPIEGVSIARAAEKVADTGAVVRAKTEGWIDRASLVAAAQRARELVRAYHEQHPHDRGIRVETLRQKLGARGGPLAADEAIRMAAKKRDDEPPVVLEGDVARMSSFFDGAARPGPGNNTLVALRDAGLKGLGEHAVTELLGLPAKEVRAVLAKLVRDGSAISAGGQWFDRPSIDALRAKVIDHLVKQPVLTIAVFKELSGLGRKQAIPLLELFDREGVTIRKGDDRARGPKAAPLAN